jgi:hypothetical protein
LPVAAGGTAFVPVGASFAVAAAFAGLRRLALRRMGEMLAAGALALGPSSCGRQRPGTAGRGIRLASAARSAWAGRLAWAFISQRRRPSVVRSSGTWGNAR